MVKMDIHSDLVAVEVQNLILLKVQIKNLVMEVMVKMVLLLFLIKN